METKNWLLNEPIEVRLGTEHGERGPHYVYLGSVRENGVIHHSLSRSGGGVPEALTNLQTKGPWPLKAVPGWQVEVLVLLRTGIYRVEEVR